MKGLNDLIQPITSAHQNIYGHTSYPTFNYHKMTKKTTLMETIGQFPTDLLPLLCNTDITDTDGSLIMACILQEGASAGSDGPAEDGIGGHAFCIADYLFTKVIWGSAKTVGTKQEMTSLRAEHGGALGILLLLHVLSMFYSF